MRLQEVSGTQKPRKAAVLQEEVAGADVEPSEVGSLGVQAPRF